MIVSLLIFSLLIFLIGLASDNTYLTDGEDAPDDTGIVERVIFLAGLPIQLVGVLVIFATAVVTRTTDDVVLDWKAFWKTIVKAATGK